MGSEDDHALWRGTHPVCLSRPISALGVMKVKEAQRAAICQAGQVEEVRREIPIPFDASATARAPFEGDRQDDVVLLQQSADAT